LSALSFLKSHPFAVEAFFESSLVLTYAVPVEQLLPLLPICLQPDTLNDKYGFVAVAMVKTKGLRPKGFPAFMGNDFILTGYRIFVRYTTSAGKRLRGLYILKSETDKHKMAFMGNLLTHYNYSKKDIDYKTVNGIVSVQIKESDFDISVDLNSEDIPLPENSPFTDWKEARRYAGPLPFTFTYKPETKQVLIIEGVRENWVPRPVKVLRSQVGFIENMGFKGAILANAFIVENIPYHWQKGKFDQWTQQ
jgi:hypothetical protein